MLERLETEHTRNLDRELLFAQNPAEMVATFIDLHLDGGPETANPEAVCCWVIVSGEALRRSGFAGEVESAFQRMASKLCGIVRYGIEAGAFQCPAPEAAAAALVATIHGYLCLAATTLEVIPNVSAAPCVKMMAAALLHSTSPLLRDASVPPPSPKRDPRSRRRSNSLVNQPIDDPPLWLAVGRGRTLRNSLVNQPIPCPKTGDVPEAEVNVAIASAWSQRQATTGYSIVGS